MSSKLVLKKIARDFSDGKHIRRVLFPTDIEFNSGEMTLIAGPSGSGKTTLLSIMGTVLKPSEGSICYDGLDITGLDDNLSARMRMSKYGFIFQQPMLIEGLCVKDNILLSLGIQGKKVSAENKKRADYLLKSLGLEEFYFMQPRLLSGGMKQRASIARALINSPSILLCDEPTSSLDAENGQVVMSILKKVASEEKRIVVVVSHDARVFPYADRLIKLENGRVVSDTQGK